MKISHTINANNVAGWYVDIETQIDFATSLALNATARQIREAIVEDMRVKFDRPTPYTLNALRVVPATKDTLLARVTFKERAGKGISAHDYLPPQVFGGRRNKKRSEKALAMTGTTGDRYYVPGQGAEMDAYGNMNRGQVVKILSYLEAFGEQGYKANSTPKSRAKINRGTTKRDGTVINGVRYFVSRGKGTPIKGAKEQHLRRGVYSVTGPKREEELRPLMIFVDNDPTYTPLLPFFETAEEIFTSSYEDHFDEALDRAINSARAKKL